MRQAQVLESITSHLDDLNALLKWALLLAVGFWWAGTRRKDEFEALGMTFHQTHALFVAVGFYLIVNITVLERFLRLADLVALTDEANLKEAVSRLGVHPWVLNPFSYFGLGMLARTHSAKGLGSLIVVWWVCNSSLYSLAHNVLTPVGILIHVTFLGAGVASIFSINRVFSVVLERTERLEPELYQSLRATKIERTVCAIAGIGLGALIAVLTLWLCYSNTLSLPKTP